MHVSPRDGMVEYKLRGEESVGAMKKEGDQLYQQPSMTGEARAKGENMTQDKKYHYTY